MFAATRQYLVFGNTLSEIIIPILDENSGAVLDTIDVESEQVNAFSEDDRKIF